MRAVVLYESVFGNTHEVADGIADGLRGGAEVRVVPAHDAAADVLDGIDLVVVGAPTHVHSLPRERTRKDAVEHPEHYAADVEPDADEPGVREWLDDLARGRTGAAAAFDTRAKGPALLTGRASTAIARQLRRHGFHLAVEPESFLVEHERLVEGEAERARSWGAALAARAATPGA